jgi:hypothetical protein
VNGNRPPLSLARSAVVLALLFGAVPLVSAAEPAATAPAPDQRLDPGERVFTVTVGDEPRAYVMADLTRVGVPVHDVVNDLRFDVTVDAGDAHVVDAPPSVHAEGTTTWADWSRAHPETSVWRPAAVAEKGRPRDAREIRVTTSHDYRTVLGSALAPSRGTEADTLRPGVLVISGTIENTARDPVHYVVLRYELVDRRGRVVYREEGFNRAAEVLAEAKLPDSAEVPPIAPGAGDTFRLILVADEVPAFEHARVTVGRVY